jgi:hypothetical protein
MNAVLDVIEIDTLVVLGEDIPARITALEVRGSEHLLTYEVRWWDGQARKTEWVTPREIKPVKHCRTLRFNEELHT